ncbi:MAG: hypothetical protein K6F70_07805 [Eggerthellaceae bacterium]|nr:hypothetical protein [Eggerthellaceae bacterium]
MEQIEFKMPTDGSLLSAARYTITPEYGHLMHNAISKLTGKSKYEVFREVRGLAVRKNGATRRDLSDYGHTNYHEFFAEAFANANSGAPNAIGQAMNDHLDRYRR